VAAEGSAVAVADGRPAIEGLGPSVASPALSPPASSEKREGSADDDECGQRAQENRLDPDVAETTPWASRELGESVTRRLLGPVQSLERRSPTD
jgi:hypothetical protein